MADERGLIIGDRVEARLDGLEQSMAELKGTVAQMDKRLSSVEAAIGGLRQEVHQEIGGLRQEMRQEIGDLRKDNRQSFNWMLGMWITTILAILTMSLTILSRIR